MKSKRKFPQHKARVTKKLADIISTKLNGKVSEKEMLSVAVDLKRFVRVVHRIVTEPQFRVYYKENKSGKKVRKQKVVETDIKEFKKTLRGKKGMSITKAFQNLEETVNKNER